MSEITDRRTEFRRRITELIHEYEDMTGPLGSYAFAVAGDPHSESVDEWTAEEIAGAHDLHMLSGWVLAFEWVAMEPGPGKTSHMQRHMPDGQSDCLTTGILSEADW